MKVNFDIGIIIFKRGFRHDCVLQSSSNEAETETWCTVRQCVLFRGYATPNFDRVITFSMNSYSFHRIGLKLSGQIDHEWYSAYLPYLKEMSREK